MGGILPVLQSFKIEFGLALTITSTEMCVCMWCVCVVWCVCVCMWCVCMWVGVRVCVVWCVGVCVCVRTCGVGGVCVCALVCVCMYIYIYIYSFTFIIWKV